MKLLKNQGTDRVIDELRASLAAGGSLDAATPDFSLFAFGELREVLRRLAGSRLIVPLQQPNAQSLLGSDADRGSRNQLSAHKLSRDLADWLRKAVEVKGAPGQLPQATLVAKNADAAPVKVISGNCPLTTDGLGITPANQFSLVQSTETPEESQLLAAWFTQMWDALPATADAKATLLAQLDELTAKREPSLIYLLTIYHLFKDRGDELDEDKIVKSATGIRETVVWKKLFKFQRDGVIGAIDKLERLGGCIIADSVGLGKTFEALAIIKYYELRNDRVLVLVPKRLRDNWTLYKTNDRRNLLAPDRLNYDVLNHTDLSRDGGNSGDIDLSHVNWGNYDLVVIDESHNFRNKKSPRQGQETRYDRLMRRIIKEGVKTRVLMLSATPVNNRLADLKNQIAFVTEGNDTALLDHGITSIESTVRKAQLQFNRWLASAPADRTSPRLIEMLGFDYFKLLDLLTIARSRRHIEKYYGTAETGKFPERLKPINHKPDVDSDGQFSSIREINNEIRRLTLAAYAPLCYVLPGKQAAYDAKYSTQIRGGESFFRQVDREESLIHLIRINVLKRMESAVPSFALTVKCQRSRPAQRRPLRPDREAMARRPSRRRGQHPRPRAAGATRRAHQSRKPQFRAHPPRTAPAGAPAQVERNRHHPDAHPPFRQQRQTPEVMSNTATIRRALPGQLFYSTQIPVCLWFLAKNKSAHVKRGFRDRRQQTFFIDGDIRRSAHPNPWHN